jgi:DNA anti-recombination protein RmuC
MAVALKMPETPEELAVFVRGVRDHQALELQRESLAELRQLSERQARIEGRVEELSHTVQLYRGDFHSLLERFDHFQGEVRAENEKFRQETRTENEKLRQEIWGRFEKIDQRFEKIDQRFERMEGRLFDMQKSLTVQTRWLIALLVAAPIIYSVLDKVLNRLLP